MPDYQQPSDAKAGTSAIQHAEPDAELLIKESATTTQTARATEAQRATVDIDTNIRSIYWARRILRANGTHAWSFGFPSPVEVFADSQVAVSMTEIDGNDQPFLGPATMQVFNVVPQADGTILVRFNVDWGSQLRVMFNFIIVN